MQKLILILATAVFSNQICADSVYDAHTKVELITESIVFNSSETFVVGLRMNMDPDWHVYWKNPGDSGLAPKIEWQLPEGFNARPIQWPIPSRIEAPPLTSFGYEKEVLLLTEIKTPLNINSEETLFIKAVVNWLACKVDCIPGKAELALKIPEQRSENIYDPQIKMLFDKTREQLPLSKSEWQITFEQDEDSLFISLMPPKLSTQTPMITFFPEEGGVIENAAAQVLNKNEEGFELVLRKSHIRTIPVDRIKGVMVNSNGWDEASLERKGLEIDLNVLNQSANELLTNSNRVGLLLACLFAFIGGLILNIMPCVLPVLSIKVLSLINHKEENKDAVVHGLIFSAGVIISFWILAALLLVLKFVGYKIGWGFQFQSPGFVIFISIVFFMLALNLFGIYEIGNSLQTLASNVPRRNYYSNSFLHGILATIVATPCTAPFMGTALGFALSQNAATSILVFTFLGLGMALPFFILCAFPKFLKFIPKPGAWMIHFKFSLGFILLACNVWLVWVLGLQKGIEAVAALLISFIFLTIAAWIYGLRQQSALRGPRSVILIVVFLSLALATSFWDARDSFNSTTLKQNAEDSKSIGWIPYSAEEFKRARQGTNPIFIDFTAAWCLTCQVNDRLVLQKKSVVEAFKKNKVVMLKADWTNYDEEITQALNRYNRTSIPLYVFYPDPQGEPILFPELITPEIILDALAQIKPDQK